MIKAFFKLIRWQNLLIIAVSMIFIRYFVILPGLRLQPAGGMDIFYFILLVSATLFTAVGGYLLNDITDKDVDEYNKPGKNQVGKHFSEKTVQKLYWIFTAAGIIAGSWLSIALHHANYSLIFILTAGLLWFYAKRYQCQPLVGNIVVAFLSALSFGLVWLYEFVYVYSYTSHLDAFKEYFVFTNKMVAIYMGFAFLASLAREIVKDLEDYKGDDRFGCRTFAVAFGTGAAKTLGSAVLILGFLFSGFVQRFFYINNYMYLYYFFYAVDILFILNVVRLIKSEEQHHFKMLSSHLKVLMTAGILSMILCYYSLLYAG